MELQDKNVDLDRVTVYEDESVFHVNEIALRTYEKGQDVQMDITIEMNRDLISIGRKSYNFLDVLSDVGGI